MSKKVPIKYLYKFSPEERGFISPRNYLRDLYRAVAGKAFVERGINYRISDQTKNSVLDSKYPLYHYLNRNIVPWQVRNNTQSSFGKTAADSPRTTIELELEHANAANESTAKKRRQLLKALQLRYPEVLTATEDPSLDRTGVELSVEYKNKKRLKALLKELHTRGYRVSPRTGLHIHSDFSGIPVEKVLRMLLSYNKGTTDLPGLMPSQYSAPYTKAFLHDVRNLLKHKEYSKKDIIKLLSKHNNFRINRKNIYNSAIGKGSAVNINPFLLKALGLKPKTNGGGYGSVEFRAGYAVKPTGVSSLSAAVVLRALDKIKQIRKKMRIDKTAADFAPGLPSKTNYGNLKKLPLNKLITYSLQLHKAKKAGTHHDLRIGTKKGLFSWAIPKLMPKPGERKLAIRTQLHRGDYADFEGVIGKGYGSGTVKLADRGSVLVTEASPTKVKFVVTHHKYPQTYTLIKSHHDKWYIINTTPQKSNALDIHKKVHYAEVDPDKAEALMDGSYAATAKIDGAAALLELLKDKIEVVSYRPTKEGLPIIHTYRVGNLINKTIPKEYRGAVFRGELYGERNGKVIPPQELGGLLNSTTEKSIVDQNMRGVKLKAAVFNVLHKPGGVPKGFKERQQIIKDMIRRTGSQDKLTVLKAETNKERIKKMMADIKAGRNPATKEGVVFHPLAGGKPVKAKFKQDYDVIIKNIFPAKIKKGEPRAGGFEYSLPGQDKIVGRVGTGFSHATLKDMLANSDRYIGRRARIQSQGQFPSGAYRAPGFIALHEDYPQEKLQKTGEQMTERHQMEDWFKKRTAKHISLVVANWKKLLNDKERRKKYLSGLKKPALHILKHDRSKYREPEKIPYIYITWDYKMKADGKKWVIPERMKKRMEQATTHHVFNNSHHPVYWDKSKKPSDNVINKKDRDKPVEGESVNAFRMPAWAIAEMVCDWAAVSQERGTSLRAWADKNVGTRWKFTPWQVKEIYDLVEFFENKRR